MNATKQGLAPIARRDAQLFILGSLPGDVSLAECRYYAHPTNQFWRLVGGALRVDLQSLEYDQRLVALADRRIGLWDVIASARRIGSGDSAIRDASHNRLDLLTRDFPELRAIAFNGSTASVAGRRAASTLLAGVQLFDLPSSSAANTIPFDAKAEAWGVIGRLIR